MKKFVLLLVVLSMIFASAACGSKDNGSSATDTPNTETQSVSVRSGDALLAAQCLQGLAGSENAQEAEAYLTEDSYSRAQDMVDYYKSNDVTVETEFLCDCNGYDVYSYKMDGGFQEEGVAMLLWNGENYKLCVNAEAQQKLREDLMCRSCQGSGTLTTGDLITCAICGGTGTQYYPNVYFDPATNMWMGQNMACSGCAGAGHQGNGSTVTCTTCDGMGIVFG